MIPKFVEQILLALDELLDNTIEFLTDLAGDVRDALSPEDKTNE